MMELVDASAWRMSFAIWFNRSAVRLSVVCVDWRSAVSARSRLSSPVLKDQ
jgi:hypothetical protein